MIAPSGSGTRFGSSPSPPSRISKSSPAAMPMSDALSSASVAGVVGVTEPLADGERELLARVHPAADPVCAAGVDAGVAVHVVGIGATPHRDEVVLALERRAGRVAVPDCPAQPAQQLLRDVPITLVWIDRWARELRRSRCDAPSASRPVEVLVPLGAFGRVGHWRHTSLGTSKKTGSARNERVPGRDRKPRSSNEYRCSPCTPCG